jgi:hypothetical protein
LGGGACSASSSRTITLRDRLRRFRGGGGIFGRGVGYLGEGPGYLGGGGRCLGGAECLARDVLGAGLARVWGLAFGLVGVEGRRVGSGLAGGGAWVWEQGRAGGLKRPPTSRAMGVPLWPPRTHLASAKPQAPPTSWRALDGRARVAGRPAQARTSTPKTPQTRKPPRNRPAPHFLVCSTTALASPQSSFHPIWGPKHQTPQTPQNPLNLTSWCAQRPRPRRWPRHPSSHLNPENPPKTRKPPKTPETSLLGVRSTAAPASLAAPLKLTPQPRKPKNPQTPQNPLKPHLLVCSTTALASLAAHTSIACLWCAPP